MHNGSRLSNLFPFYVGLYSCGRITIFLRQKLGLYYLPHMYHIQLMTDFTQLSLSFFVYSTTALDQASHIWTTCYTCLPPVSPLYTCRPPLSFPFKSIFIMHLDTNSPNGGIYHTSSLKTLQWALFIVISMDRFVFFQIIC